MSPGIERSLRLERVLFSTVTELRDVAMDIRRLLASHGLQPYAFAIELLARESLMNAITHGNAGDADKRVRLHLAARRHTIELRVEDEGRGFDWRTVEASAPPETLAPGGRGLAIYRAYADRVRFNQQGNQVTFLVLKRAGEGR